MAGKVPGSTVATFAMVVVLVAGAVAAVLLTHRSPVSGRMQVTSPEPPSASPPSPVDPTPAPGHRAAAGGPAKLSDPTGEACVRPPRRQVLDVLTYNIHATVGPDERVHLDSLLQEIEHWQPDVVLLQEVDRFKARSGGIDTPAALADQLGWSWTFGGNLQQGAGRYGNAILSRFPIVTSRQQLLPNPTGTEQRGLLHAVVNVRGAQVSIYATHLDQRSPIARIAQAHAIVSQLRADPLPIILGGDLNSHPGSPAVRILDGLLTDTWGEVGQGLGRSVPRARIDYLLHADADRDTTVTPRRAAVLPSSFSDHDPVWASYEIRGLGNRVCVPVFGG